MCARVAVCGGRNARCRVIHVHSSRCAFAEIPWLLSEGCAMEGVFLSDSVASARDEEEKASAGLGAVGLRRVRLRCQQLVRLFSMDAACRGVWFEYTALIFK